jgi:hypothetical protein
LGFDIPEIEADAGEDEVAVEQENESGPVTEAEQTPLAETETETEVRSLH